MNIPNQKTSLFRALGALTVLSGLATATQALAQAVPAPEAAQQDDESTIVLSPFTVSAEEDNGYVATSTLAGTRIKTELKDVGSAISVVTQKFLKDTGATDNTSLLQYTTSTEVGGVRGNFSGAKSAGVVNEKDFLIAPQQNTRVRGLSSADNTRNFFMSDIPWDAYNVARVELQRGPNSMLFGLGSPAGIINTTTNDASFKNGGSIEARYGRYNSVRGSIDDNYVLIPKELALRVDSVYDKRNYRQAPAFSTTRRLYAALRYDPRWLSGENYHTTIKANAEVGDTNSNNPRQVPPSDNISPWFDSAQLAKLTLDPISAWNDPKLGDVWTPHGTLTPNGIRTASLLNNPYLAQMGQPNAFQSGLLYNQGGFVAGRTFTQTSWAQFYPDGKGGLTQIKGVPYGEQSSIAGYSRIASNLNLPYASSGQYKDKTIKDAGVFDFYNNLIDGNNKREWQDWNTANISLEQTFFHDVAGYQFSYDEQYYTNGQWAMFNNPGINVDVNQYLADGTPNPNVGRAYVCGSGNGWGNSSYQSNSESYRGTLFGELRTEDILGKNTLTKALGHHRVTVLLSKDTFSNDARNFRLYAADADYAKTTQSPDKLINNNQRDVQILAYLSPNMSSWKSPTGLSTVGNINIPNKGDINYFDATYKASAPAAAGSWTGFDDKQTGWTNADNPLNYNGWSNRSVHLLSYFDGDLDKLYTSAVKKRSIVESKAANMQSHFWDGTFVSTFGVRQDSVRYFSRALGNKAGDPAVNSDGTYDPSNNSYSFAYRDAVLGSDKGTTRSMSFVLHLPKELRNKLPGGLDVSLLYNTSDNFKVSTTRREDIYGNVLPNPKGKTTDIGFVISAFNDKFTIKVNKFKNEVQNDSFYSDISNIAHLMSMGYNHYRIFQANWDRTASAPTHDANSQGIGPWTAAWNFADGGKFGDNASLVAGETREGNLKTEGDMISAWDKFLTTPEYAAFSKRWFPNGQAPDSVALTAPWTGYSLATNGGNPNFTTTADNTAKGYEIEMTASPLKGLSLMANVSKIDATQTNVGGGQTEYFVNKVWIPFMRGPGGAIRFWGSNSTGDTLLSCWKNWGVAGNWARSTLGVGSSVAELRPWHVNLVTNYEFQGHGLKGFNIGGGYRWEAKNIIGYKVTSTADGYPLFDLNTSYKGPDNTTIDCWVGYDFKLGKKLRNRIQLNVDNVFASKKLIPISTQPDGTPANYRLPEGLGWTLTNTLSF